MEVVALSALTVGVLMNRRNLLVLALLSALIFSPVGVASAQLGFSEPGQQDPIAQLLTEGRQLESDERWGEALTHYEDAARRFPKNTKLKQRVLITRIQFDLDRRYTDSSYTTSLPRMSEQQAMDLFSEVILKIQSHYVISPNWDLLLMQGTQDLDIALRDPDFLRVNRIQPQTGKVDQVVNHVRRVLSERHIKDRQQTQEMVRWIGRYTAHHTGTSTAPVILEYVCGFANCLDAYSTYLTADQLDDVYSQIEGNFVGLGIELKADDGSLLIANVIPKGPAERAGIKAGERIVAVDGQSTRDVTTDRAADMLKGEQGTYVQVTLLAPDSSSRDVAVRRERVEVPSVEDVKMIDRKSGVAYFSISSFQKTTSHDVDTALWKLHRDGMRSLIVDVRGNPGGLLTEAVEVADRFVEDGTIVSTHGRSARENFDYKAHRVGTWRVPLVVLIDGDSASASEIFAGAIRDHRRGTVVGIRSYGKGSVQGIFPLRVVKGGVRLTTAKFLAPSGQAISEQGIQPNVTVHVTAKPVDGQFIDNNEDDPVLKAGVKTARDLVALREERLRSEAKSMEQDQASNRRSSRRSSVSW